MSKFQGLSTKRSKMLKFGHFGGNGMSPICEIRFVENMRRRTLAVEQWVSWHPHSAQACDHNGAYTQQLQHSQKVWGGRLCKKCKTQATLLHAMSVEGSRIQFEDCHWPIKLKASFITYFDNCVYFFFQQQTHRNDKVLSLFIIFLFKLLSSKFLISCKWLAGFVF